MIDKVTITESMGRTDMQVEIINVLHTDEEYQVIT